MWVENKVASHLYDTKSTSSGGIPHGADGEIEAAVKTWDRRIRKVEGAQHYKKWTCRRIFGGLLFP